MDEIKWDDYSIKNKKDWEILRDLQKKKLNVKGLFFQYFGFQVMDNNEIVGVDYIYPNKNNFVINILKLLSFLPDEKIKETSSIECWFKILWADDGSAFLNTMTNVINERFLLLEKKSFKNFNEEEIANMNSLLKLGENIDKLHSHLIDVITSVYENLAMDIKEQEDV